MIQIKSKRHNFRRCGIAHPADAVDYPDDRFTPEELKILQAEPMLIVEVVLKKQPEPPAETTETAKETASEQAPGKANDPGNKPANPARKGKR